MCRRLRGMVGTVRKQDIVAMHVRDARRASETENVRTVRNSSNQGWRGWPNAGIADRLYVAQLQLGQVVHAVGEATKNIGSHCQIGVHSARQPKCTRGTAAPSTSRSRVAVGDGRFADCSCDAPVS